MAVQLTSGVLFSHLQYNRAQERLAVDYSRLSSGVKLAKAEDDPSDYALSNGLRADAKMLRVARQNSFDGLSFIQIADGVQDEVTNILTRAVELATQAASGTTSMDGKAALDEEYQELLNEIDRLNTETDFGNVQVFGSSILVQFGDTSNEAVTLTTASVDRASFSLTATDLTTEAGASNVLNLASMAIDTVSQQRSALGAKSNRLRETLDIIDQKILDTTSAESTMRDADMAMEITRMTAHQMQQQSAQSALSQASLSAQRVLSLFA